jgi:AcrR family transcriptional regulator
MPRRAFEKLEREKREKILAAAAEEFARLGFHDASLNGIIERAGLSKGAMYYYFEDKADLYQTVLTDRFGGLLQTRIQLPDAQKPEAYWAAFDGMIEQSLRLYREDPIVAGLYRSFLTLVRRGEDAEALRPLMKWAADITRELVQRGQAVGAVRTDLPTDLLVEMLRGMDDASNRWLAAHLDEIDLGELERVSRLTMQMLRAALSPPAAPAAENTEAKS